MIIDRYFKSENDEEHYREKVKKFIANALTESCQEEKIKEKIENYYQRVTSITSYYRMEKRRLEKVLDNCDNSNNISIFKMVSDKYNTKAELLEGLKEAEDGS